MGKANAQIQCQPLVDLPRILHECLVGVVSRVVVGVVIRLVIFSGDITRDDVSVQISVRVRIGGSDHDRTVSGIAEGFGVPDIFPEETGLDGVCAPDLRHRIA